MKNRLVATGGVIAALAFAPGAPAKSDPHLATVTGPGLDEPIVLRTDGQGRGWPHAATLAEAAGLHTALWGEPRHKLRAERPAGELGPKYVAAYRFASGEVRQELYPYARPKPVSYVQPGQRFSDRYTASGGWYVDAPVLADTLVYAGLPKDPPAPRRASIGPLAIVLLTVACLGAIGTLRTRVV